MIPISNLKIKKNLIYGLIVFSSFIVISYLSVIYEHWLQNNHYINRYMMGKTRLILYVLTFPFFYILIGIIIGIEKLIWEFKKVGKWKIDKGRLIFLGIPSFYLTFYAFIYFYLQIFSLPSNISIFLTSDGFNQIAGIIFGYFFITSFYKES